MPKKLIAESDDDRGLDVMTYALIVVAIVLGGLLVTLFLS